MNDPKVFKLGTGNDLGLSYKWSKGQRSSHSTKCKNTFKAIESPAWVRTYIECPPSSLHCSLESNAEDFSDEPDFNIVHQFNGAPDSVVIADIAMCA